LVEDKYLGEEREDASLDGGTLAVPAPGFDVKEMIVEPKVVEVEPVSGDMWGHGDVSCSSPRRRFIEDGFFAADGICESTLTVLNEMGIFPAMLAQELNRYLPFLASTSMLMYAVKNGMGREEAHGVIKKHSVAVALARQEGENPDLVQLLGQDPKFQQYGITSDSLQKFLEDPYALIGNAELQTARVIAKTRDLIDKYPEAAKYEPGTIL